MNADQTPPLTAADLDALEAAAKAATPGPWRSTWDDPVATEVAVCRDGKCDDVESSIRKSVMADDESVVSVEYYDGYHTSCTRENAAYIAAAKPATVLRLIAEVRRLRAASAGPASPAVELPREAPPAKAFRPLIALDFDGVLHSYTSKFTPVPPDPPVPGSQQFVRDIVAAGFDVCVYTSRTEDDVQDGARHVAEWLRCHGFPDIQVAVGKPKAQVYIDDRAFRFEGDFEKALAFCTDAAAREPWNKRAPREAPPGTIRVRVGIAHTEYGNRFAYLLDQNETVDIGDVVIVADVPLPPVVQARVEPAPAKEGGGA